MNKSIFASQSVLLLLVLSMIAGCVFAGIGLVLTNQQCEQIGQDIKKGEARLDELRKDNDHLERQKREFTEQISLQKVAEARLGGSLRRPDPNSGQIMVVSRQGARAWTPAQMSQIRVSEPSRFGVLDIAFMVPASEQGRLRQ